MELICLKLKEKGDEKQRERANFAKAQSVIEDQKWGWVPQSISSKMVMEFSGDSIDIQFWERWKDSTLRSTLLQSTVRTKFSRASV